MEEGKKEGMSEGIGTMKGRRMEGGEKGRERREEEEERIERGKKEGEGGRRGRGKEGKKEVYFPLLEIH